MTLAALGLALAASPGAAQTTTAPADAQPGATTAPTTAQEFVPAAVSSNGFEIESSRLALENAQGEAVRSFAQQMIDDHTAATQQLLAAAEQEGLAQPELRLTPRHSQLLAQLQQAQDAEFDELYTTLQVQAHQEAVTLHSNYAEAGEEGAVRSFATETLPVLEQHLTMAQELDAS